MLLIIHQGDYPINYQFNDYRNQSAELLGIPISILLRKMKCLECIPNLHALSAIPNWNFLNQIHFWFQHIKRG